MTTYKIKSAALAFTAAFGITAATLLATGAPAHARDVGPKSRTVIHRDLDLGTEAGRTALQRRVARAATGVCVDRRELSPAVRIARRKCIAGAIAAAGPSVDRVVLRDVAAREARQAGRIELKPGS